jgi:hypothetical protein
VNFPSHKPAGMQITSTSGCDQFLNEGLQVLCLGKRGLDPAMAQQGCSLSPRQSDAVAAVPVKFSPTGKMSHKSLLQR